MNEAIDSLPWSARHVFKCMLPLMREGREFHGLLPLTRHELSVYFKTSEGIIDKAFGILIKRGFIKKCKLGYFSPIVVREITVELRSSHDRRAEDMPSVPPGSASAGENERGKSHL